MTPKRYLDEADSSLVEKTLLGDDSAYEALILRYEKAVKSATFYVTGNRFSAEDAAQDAFVSAWMNLGSLREREKFGAWVCAIARRCAHSVVMRYNAVIPDISLDLLLDADWLKSEKSGVSDLFDSASLGEKERDEKLHDTVNALNLKIREVVALHYFEGLSVAEIATHLSLPEGTVKWRLCEGRKQLRKEYGMMEKEYNENQTLVERVMRQVEELKLWGLRNDTTGFEKDYRAVLSAIDMLDESSKKQHALAEVLMRGYWWLPGEKNDKVFKEIKRAAEEGKNESAMLFVMAQEREIYKKGQERRDYMINVQIPYLEKLGMTKAIGDVLFWYGASLIADGKKEEGLAAFRKVLEILEKEDTFYALAMAALETESLRFEIMQKKPGIEVAYGTAAEKLICRDNVWYYLEQPGYSRGGEFALDYDAFSYFASRCDGILLDPNMKLKEKKLSSNGKSSICLIDDRRTVVTAAGVFENCRVYCTECRWNKKDIRVETAFCSGVGIVMQKVWQNSKRSEWQLAKYRIVGGEGYLPLAAGNDWNYIYTGDTGGYIVHTHNHYAVVYTSERQAVMMQSYVGYADGYDDSFVGQMQKMRHQYCIENGENEQLQDVTPVMERLKALASTKREKRFAAISCEVMDRILKTDPDFNPHYTEKGRWNFFDVETLIKNEKGIAFIFMDDEYQHYEWKDMSNLNDSALLRGKEPEGSALWKHGHTHALRHIA